MHPNFLSTHPAPSHPGRATPPASPTPSRRRSDPKPQLKHDNQDGAFLIGHRGHTAVIAEPGLRCLDLVDCPDLADLDLTQCRPDLHLTVRDCPALSHIQLPRVPETGAIVHLDCGNDARAIRIRGHLNGLDAFIAGRPVATQPRRPRQVLINAYLGPWAENESLADDGLAVLWGELPHHLSLADQAAPKELIVFDAPALASIHASTSMDTVSVTDVPALTHVDLAGGCRRFRAIHAPALAHLAGHGRTAVLASNSGAAQRLTVDGEWRALRLSESPVTDLSAPQVASIALAHCPDLRYVTRGEATTVSVMGPTRAVGLGIERLRLDASTLRYLARAARAGDTEAATLLGDWCGEATHPRGWLDALEVFAELAGKGFDPAWLWGLRCGLHARANRSLRDDEQTLDPVDLAVKRWHWELPEDLGDRGWRADLVLWLACRHLPWVAGFERLLKRTGRPRHLATMARVAMDPTLDPADTQLVGSLLEQALRTSRPVPERSRRHGVKPPDLVPARHELFFVDHYLEPIWQRIVAERDRAMAEALAGYVQRQLDPERQIHPLTRLLRLGITEVRPMLMALSRQLRDDGDADGAGDAMAAALSPADSTLFTTNQAI